MEKTSIVAKKQCLNFAEDVNALLLATTREYGFPLHRLLNYWGRRDIVLLYVSRELYGWEKKLAGKQGVNEQGKETILTQIWRQSKITDEVFERWSRFCQKRYRITAKKMCFFSSFLRDEREYGYILGAFCEPFFITACTVAADQSDVDCCNYVVINSANLLMQNSWTEETMNVELCRLLRETGGKGPERCRVMVLDDHHILFILSGFIIEGFRNVADCESTMITSLIYIIKRQLWACIQSLLVKMGVQSVRCDIELELEQNEASIMVVI